MRAIDRLQRHANFLPDDLRIFVHRRRAKMLARLDNHIRMKVRSRLDRRGGNPQRIALALQVRCEHGAANELNHFQFEPGNDQLSLCLKGTHAGMA